MNFVGKFDAKQPFDDPDIHSGRHFNVDSFSAHAPADAIVVPDVHLLFGGDYKRSGVDLILSDSDHELVLHDYFKGEKRAALAAPEGGAHLTGDVVSALAGGHVQYAQAGGATAAAAVVGHVTKLVGSATAIRNGVSIVLAHGDNIEKGDVLQSGPGSTLGVTFIDGTVFGLSSNARMVVNELVYDPNGSNNSSLLSLVQGTISFVAGETAKHGDMKVDTPVATMGIRGTAVLVQIDFDTPGGTPDAKFQVLVEPDGHTGSYILYDKTTLDPIATVNQAGHQVNISHGVVTYSTNGLSPELQKLITDVFALKFSDNTNPNTKSLDHFTDSIVPLTFTPFKFVNVPNLTPITFTVNNTNGPAQSSFGPLIQIQHIPIAPSVSAHGGTEAERIGVTGDSAVDKVSGTVSFADINIGDRPTAAVAFDSISYQTTQHQDVTSLLSQQQLAALASAISISQDSGNTNQGAATWSYNIADKAFDFLGAGETLTLTYLVEVSNNYAPDPQVTTVPITITITGTNDVPVITSSVPKTIVFNGNISTADGDLVATTPTSGTISFTDPDLTDTHKVSVALVETALDGTAATLSSKALDMLESVLSASIATDSTDTGTGKINWSLADLPASLEDFIPNGETLTLTYAVTVTDSQGATATQDITVTISSGGVVWVATAADGSPSGGLWSDPSNWSTAAVPTANDDVSIITDPQHGRTPAYPVTIDAPATAGSLTMNDFGTSPPELINQSTLNVSGAFSMSADSIVENYGTITVGGLMAIGDDSVLDNFGTLTLEQGGEFNGQSTIFNAAGGTIEISGGTLAVEVDIDNAGSIAIDASGTLMLEAATISGGALTNYGTFDLAGSAVLQSGALKNFGRVNISGTGNRIDHEAVTNSGTIEVLSCGALTLDQGTAIANSKGAMDVDSDATLMLNDATITGGTLNNSGTVDIEGSSGATLDGVAVAGPGAIQVDTPDASATTLVLQNGATMTGGKLTIGSVGALGVKGPGGATLKGVSITNDNSIEIFAASLLALAAGTTVANKGEITVDSKATLTLNDASITGGTIADHGLVDVTGDSAINGADLTGGHMTVDAGQVLTLDNVTVSYAHVDGAAKSSVIEIDGGDALTLYHATISGGMIDDYSAVSGGIVDGYLDIAGSSSIRDAALNHGHVTIERGQTLALDSVTVSYASFDDTAKGAVIQVDGGDTLTLYDASITGGSIDGYSDVAGHIVDGYLDIAGSSTISDAALNHGHVTVESGQTLTLDNVAVSYASFNDSANGAIIQVDGGDTLTLYHVTIAGGSIDNYTSSSEGVIGGHIDVAGSSAIDHASLSNGDVTVEAGQTLTLDDVVATGTTFDAAAKGATVRVDSGDKLTLNGVTIDGGTLAVNGSLEIAGSSTIEHAVLDNARITVDSGATLTLHDVAAACSTITLAGSNDTLNLDSTFHGAIAGWSSGDTINLTDLAYSASETAVWNAANHTLSISNGTQTEVLQLDGEYTQNDFALAQDGSGHTELLWNDVPATLGMLNNHGDAVAGNTLTAGLNDPDATGVTFTWLEDGKVIPAQMSSSFTPTSADLGKAIDVVVGFTDHGVTEQLTETAGTVVAPPVLCETHPPVHTWAYNPGNANFDFLKPGDKLTFDAGGSTVEGTSGDDTFVKVGGGVTIFGHGGHDTFVFNDHFGSATIADFNVHQDTIDLSHTLFASVSDILASAHPADFGHDTIITDAAHDHITLTGVTVAQLQAHANDFHLV